MKPIRGRNRIPAVIRRPLYAIPLVALGCRGNPENSAACGFASIAAASMIMQSLQDLSHVVEAPPRELPPVLPAKVVAHGTARALVQTGPQGLAVHYQGEAFPRLPGFGLLLVDDSLEVARGILIYEPEPPQGYPKLGTIAGGETTLPLYGLRVHWPSLNAPRCPLFQPVAADSADR